MKFTVERAKLLEAVSKLQSVVGSKTAMPVLEGILISAEQGKITLIAYNLEMGMKKEIYAKTDEAGDIVIGARLLADILRRMNGVQVEISADDRLNCNIKSGEATFDIMGMSASDFPEMPSVADTNGFKVNSAVLAETVKGTIFATAQNEGAKPILTGINFEIADGYLKLIAIDGFRLAIRKEKVNIDETLNFVISGRAVAEAMKIVNDEEQEIAIFIGRRHICFEIEGYSFISRLLDGEFIDYKKTIPEQYSQTMKVNTRDIVEIIERISLIISDNFTTPVRCIVKENETVFSCVTSVGRATETAGIMLQGQPFEIGLNSKYLLEALRASDYETVNICFNGGSAAVVIKPDDDSFTYMIMPMRLR